MRTESLLPDPQNLALLAVVGIGAWWFFNRGPGARRPAAIAADPTEHAAPVTAPVSKRAQDIAAGASLIDSIGRIFGGSSSRTAAQLASADGVAFNPPTGSPYDALVSYLG